MLSVLQEAPRCMDFAAVTGKKTNSTFQNNTEVTGGVFRNTLCSNENLLNRYDFAFDG